MGQSSIHDLEVTSPPATAWRVVLALLAVAVVAAWVVVALDLARAVGRTFPGFLVDPRGFVWMTTDPAWTGPQAGLRPYERIVAMDGRAAPSPAELAAHAAARPPGTDVAYRVAGAAGERTVVVATQTFAAGDAARVVGWILAPALFFLVVGLAAFGLRSRLAAAQAFLLFAIVIAAMLVLTWDHGAAHRFDGLLVPASYAFAAATVLVGLAFPEPAGWLARRPWRAAWLLGPVAALVAVDRAFDRITPYHLGAYLFAAVASACLVWLMAHLVRAAYRSSSALARARAQVVLLGLGATLLAVPTNALIVAGLIPAHAGLELFRLTLALAATFPLSIAYAIVKHQLFDIQLVVRRTVVYAIVVAGLGALYFATAALARLALDVVVYGAAPLLGQVLATGAVTVGFVPLRERVRAEVDARFFRAPYDYGQVVAGFTDRAQAALDLPHLAEAFLDAVDGALAPTYAAVLATDPAGAIPTVRGTWPAGAPTSAADPRLAGHLLDPGGTVLGPAAGALAGAVLLPLAFRGELAGAVVVGPPKSDRAFAARDRQLLAHLAAQLALRFKAAELYTRMEALVASRTAELHEALDRLQVAYEDLKQLDALKAAFLNTVSHELRTPLTFIMGFVDAILDEAVGEVPEAQRPYLEKALAGATQLSKLIDDLLDYARMEAGVFRLDRHELDLAALLKDVAAMTGPLLAEKRQALALDVPAELPPVAGDQIRLIQVLNNLLSNAIKYTPEGGGIALAARADAAEVRVEVRDTGIGIPAEALPHLFTKFFRVEDEATRAIKGTGLGLAIAKSLVEGHGGRIGVDSAPGRGSTFWFTVPVEAAEGGSTSEGSVGRWSSPPAVL